MIDRTQPTTPISSLTSNQETRTRNAPQGDNAPVSVAAEDKSDVTLSALTKKIQTDNSSDIDYARVAEMRAALEAGELPLEPTKIAEALVQDMFQFH